jgi:glutamate-5-semialdehyde dehydrogenase
MTIYEKVSDICQRTKAAYPSICSANTKSKNAVLLTLAEKLKSNHKAVLDANGEDISKAAENGVPATMIDRLKLTDARIESLCSSLLDVVKLEDPCGSGTCLERPQGIRIRHVRVPIGVIGVIFESRPDALVQIAALCIKSGNCAVLKGGSEALHSNRKLFDVIKNAVSNVDVRFGDTLELIETREDVSELLQYNKYINLIIPRGSNAFVQYIQKNSLIPVLGHADGICHVYIDKYADIAKAKKVVVDAKTQYVSVCNATETLLVHKDIAESVLPELFAELEAKKVKLHCCERCIKYSVNAVMATEEDWKTEYLDYELSVKVVDNIEDAVLHINTYGSGHTDGIITENAESRAYFEAYVDTSSVVVNCSTRFADGFRYGMGAEVGVSTNKYHARGPVGLDGLIIYKYILEGDGHVVADYVGQNAKSYLHRKLT